MRLIGDGLCHAFDPERPLFTDVCFAVDAGEVAALTGPSGSGKSTLLAIVAGALRATSGTVRREGSGRTAWVFQNPFGVPGRSALDHVVLPLLADGTRRREAEAQARDLLDDFGLGAVQERPFKALSGGEAQRLMLARAIAARPGLILIDEPTAQLDPVSAVGVIDVLHTLAGRGVAVLIATHDPRIDAVCTTRIRLGTVPTHVSGPTDDASASILGAARGPVSHPSPGATR